MKLHKTMATTARAAGILLAFAAWGVAVAEAQTTDPRVADLVQAGKLRVGLFLPQYGKGPDGLMTTVWVETARAYAARVGVPLAIVEHAGSHVCDLGVVLETGLRTADIRRLHAGAPDKEYACIEIVAPAALPGFIRENGAALVPQALVFLTRLGLLPQPESHP